MKRSLAVLLAVAVGAAGCGSGDGQVDPEGRTAAIGEVWALSLVQLVTVDNTFGPDHLFSEVLVLSSTDPQAGDPTGAVVSRGLTAQERRAIEEGLSSTVAMRWIDDADEFQTADLMPLIDNSVIVGVGEPQFDRKGALVPVSLWCGGLCGTWFSYRLVWENDAWRVLGPEGPIAVS